MRFYYSSGGQYVPATIKAFNAKVSGLLLYATGIWISVATHNVDGTLLKKNHNILGTRRCVVGIAFIVEIEEMSFEAKAW